MVALFFQKIFSVWLRWMAALPGLLLLASCLAPPSPPLQPPLPPTPPAEVPPLTEVGWGEVEGWDLEDPVLGLEAFLKSCRALGNRPAWAGVCSDARLLDPQDSGAARRFFEERFVPYRLRAADGTGEGTITGYYVPDLNGSRKPSARFAYPLYRVPDDLLVIDFGDLYPELKGMRLRGRLDGRRVVPYYDRAAIDRSPKNFKGFELLWVDDPVELFFLQIQGSGRVRLESGERIFVNYADQNGHPFRSIGKVLIDRGEVPREGLTMQSIKAWARQNPEKGQALLHQNPSYVFFRELSIDVQSPPGALGVPLTSGRSLAIDPRYVTLGAPVFLSTAWPGSQVPLQRLMMAQDTGGAIKGAVRADFFWGIGDEAGEFAGRMKQQGKLWVFLPRELPVVEGKVASR